MKTKNMLKLLVAIVVCQAAGFVGSLFTTPSIQTWYATLTKPTFNPPNWVFAPVWTTLFLLMGIAAFLVWRRLDSGSGAGMTEKKNVKKALGIFLMQLVLNVLWSILFFGLHSPRTAFIEIICLWLAILVTMVSFAKVSKVASWLLLPYILWVSFAAFLNYSLWILNK